MSESATQGGHQKLAAACSDVRRDNHLAWLAYMFNSDLMVYA